MNGKKTEIKRGEKGYFAPGTAAGPGRPVGSVSVIGKLKQIYEQNPDKFEAFVKRYADNPDNDKHQVEMIDGKPVAKIAGADGGPFVVAIVNYADTDTVQLPT